MAGLEDNLKQGHVKIHRSVLDNWIWGKEKKSMFEAWTYILLKANWKPGEIQIGYDVIKINRGELFTSQEQLGIAFRWDRSQVRKFLEMLKKQDMIKVNTTTKYTMITICKYDIYQDNKPTKDQRRNNDTTSSEHQSSTIEEFSNKNKELEERESAFKKFEEWVKKNANRVSVMKEPFTQDNYETLLKTYSKKEIIEIVTAMHNHAKLYDNISANLTAQNWLRRRAESNKTKPPEKDAPSNIAVKTSISNIPLLNP